MNIKTKGMHCKSCEMLVKEELEEQGASKVKVNHKTGIVEFDNLDMKQAKEIIKQEGYEVL